MFVTSLHVDNAKVVAVADVSKKALDQAKGYGVKKTYTNYVDLIADLNRCCSGLFTNSYAS
jgi:predicted dehydrogenase